MKTRKSRNEEKMVSLSSASLSLSRKQEAFIQGGTKGIDYPSQKITQGPGIFKGWENKRDRRRISYKITLVKGWENKRDRGRI